MPHVWMSHSWHMYECYMHGTCMNVTYSHMAHMWIRHGTCMNVTFMSHVWMWHGTYVNKACHWTKAPEFTDVKDLAAASVPVKPHVCIRHGTYMNDSWHVYECVYLIHICEWGYLILCVLPRWYTSEAALLKYVHEWAYRITWYRMAKTHRMP